MTGPVLGVAFGKGGQTVLAVDERGKVCTWPISELPEERTERLIRRLSARTGLGLDAVREVIVLDPESWRRCIADGDGPSRSHDTADKDAAWHEALARDAESMGDKYAARWHLARLVAIRPAHGLLRARHALAMLLAGDSKPAEAELARAIELGPRDRILDWLARRAEDLRAALWPVDALRLIDIVRDSRPGDWQVFAQRAEVLTAMEGRDGRTGVRS